MEQTEQATQSPTKSAFRVGVASFAHETCTFCPQPTTVEMFERGGVHHGQEVLERARGIPTYINGFIRVAEQEGVELVGLVSAANAWGGSSGSWVTREAFDKYTSAIVEEMEAAGNLDGILLALHGAMATEDFPRAEAEIVRRVRKAAPALPIVVTCDLHANEDEEILEAADAVFIIKTYPHIDTEETGMAAARCMVETLRGNVKPAMSIRKPGVITPSLFQGTDFSPAKDIMDRAREWEAKDPNVLYVSVAFGFAYADVPDVGATVIAITNDDPELAETVAQDVSEFIWSVREAFAARRVPKTEEGVRLALEAAGTGKTPVVLADHSDRTGDGTHVLRELIRQGARNFAIATLADEAAIARIESLGDVGDSVDVMVGGRATAWSGEPVEITGVIEFLGNGDYVATGPMGKGATRHIGNVAVLRFGDDNHVILTPALHQVLDDAIFPAVGLDSRELDIISLKSRVHFRAFYDQVAGTIIEIDAPGLGPADLTQLDYRNIPENLYPIGNE